MAYIAAFIDWPRFSSVTSRATDEAPMTAEVTRGSRSAHCSAIWASFCPRRSAIAFSADPVSGARDIIVINATRGLGDAIASGTVTPDSFSVHKSDLRIVDRRIANGQPISDDDVLAIARLAAQLEETMKWPVDIECALRDGELHLLQCRPITTLAEEFPVTWDDPEDAKLTWEREDAHFDHVFGPLASEFITHGVDYGIRKRLGAIGFPLLVRHRAFNGRFYGSEKPLVADDRMAEELTRAVNFRRAFARTLRRQWDDELLPELREQYAWMRGLAVAQMTGDDAADAWLDMWRRVSRIWTIHFIVTGSAYPVMEELAQAYEELVGGNGAEALAITQGRAPTLQRLEADLHGLAETTRRWPAIAATLADGERSVSKLADLEGGPEFARAFDAFLGEHGDIGQENFDLESVAWRDDPARVLAVVAQRLRSVGEHPDARGGGAARSGRRTGGVRGVARSDLGCTGKPAPVAGIEWNRGEDLHLLPPPGRQQLHPVTRASSPALCGLLSNVRSATDRGPGGCGRRPDRHPGTASGLRGVQLVLRLADRRPPGADQ